MRAASGESVIPPFPEARGRADPARPPGDIDPGKMLVVGDLGHGYDQPIGLDYRSDPPALLTLAWRGPEPSRDNRWIRVAPDLDAFALLLGLDAPPDTC